MSKEDGQWKKIGPSYSHQVSDIRKPIKYTLNEHPLSMNLYYYFHYKNKTYRGSTGESNIENCHTKVKEIIYDVTHGKSRKEERQKIIKFEEVVKKFLQFKEVLKRSPKTLHEYRRQSKYLLEMFKGRDVNSIQTKKEYLDYMNWRKRYYKTHKDKTTQKYKRNGKEIKGRKFSNVGDTSINREIILLGNILRFSKEFMNTLKGVEIPSSIIMGKDDRNKRDVVKYGEYRKLKKYWEEKNPYFWKIISWVDKTGIRYPSELSNIIWSDVNLKEGFVLIRNRKCKDKRNGQGDPIDTEVPLIEETKKILEELRSREGILKGPNDPVFVNDKGVQVKYINKGFKKSLSELGINENLTMYSFRHTYTTRMVKNPEIPLKMISYILGHRDTQMVDRRYSHIEGKDVRRTIHGIEEKKKKS